MNLQEQFSRYIEKEQLFNKGNRLLLAVSGGIDSVVLCELCRSSGFLFSIAHCNFQLRGDESLRDEQFVQALADKYQVALHIKRFDTSEIASASKWSIQVAARELRYSWFKELLADENLEPAPEYILTAHHGDDNIETVLMNFLKGTGISGLRGIRPRKDKLIRPLLFASREEIVRYAKQQSLSYVEDSSNASDKYTRNFFRNQLIPEVERVFPSVKDNISDNISRFRDVEILYQEAVEMHKKKLMEIKGAEIHIPVRKLMKHPARNSIAFEIIKEYGFSPHQVKDLLQLAESESGKYIVSSFSRIIRNRDWLIISPLKKEATHHIIIEKDERTVLFSGGALTLENRSKDQHHLSNDPMLAQLDAEKLKFPLLLRKWKQGDYFYPLGMRKKKKIGRFLTDRKLSLTEKESIWILETDKKIIWIAGIRIDDRFKITASTNRALLIQFTAQ